MNTTHQAVEAADLPDTVAKALRTAFSLGQTYWQQADSEYTSQHKKADVTRHKFQTLVDETVAALSLPQEVAAPVGGVPSKLSDLLDAYRDETAGETFNGYPKYRPAAHIRKDIDAEIMALAASRAPVASVAVGLQQVPVKPTKEMDAAGKVALSMWQGGKPHLAVWHAMLEATPPMAVGAGGSVGAVQVYSWGECVEFMAKADERVATPAPDQATPLQPQGAKDARRQIEALMFEYWHASFGREKQTAHDKIVAAFVHLAGGAGGNVHAPGPTDTERLDFMLANDAFVVNVKLDHPVIRYQCWKQDEDENYHTLSGENKSFATKREAIDAAILSSEQDQAGGGGRGV